MTSEILDAMKTRDRFKSINNDQRYKIWRNKVTKLINDSKKQQYKVLIEENNNKPASVWKIFKELGATKNTSKGMANCILVDGNEITDSQDIANKFNRFFVSVASQLKESNVTPKFEILEKFCDEQVPNGTLFTIPNITKEKVEKNLRNLDLSKASGTDNIGPRLLKLSASYTSESITFICNKSIQNSNFQKNGKRVK